VGLRLNATAREGPSLEQSAEPAAIHIKHLGTIEGRKSNSTFGSSSPYRNGQLVASWA
jgi:hypothetical protein